MHNAAYIPVPSGLVHVTQAKAQETPLAWHCLNSRYGQKFTLTHILEVLSFLSEPPSEEESRVNQLWPFFAQAVQEVSIDFFYQITSCYNGPVALLASREQRTINKECLLCSPGVGSCCCAEAALTGLQRVPGWLA